MNKVTVRADTVEQAVEEALVQLQTKREHVQIHVIEEPSKGFLGLGTKQAVVDVEVWPTDHSANKKESMQDSAVDPTDKAHQFLEYVLKEMDVEVNIDVHREKNHSLLHVTGSDLGIIIGRRGNTLDALQLLTNIVANRHQDQHVKIVLDAENYRKRRQDSLKQLADRLAKKVIRTRRKVVLEPMNSSERKVIHTYLQDYSGVATKSRGEDPYRHIVIYPQDG